jgi:hypothetical protein
MLLRDRDTLRELARSIVTDLRPSSNDSADYISVISLVVEAAFDTIDFECAGPTEVLDLINFCLEVEVPTATHEHLLMRVLCPPEGTSIVQHLSKILVPLLSHLHDTLAQRGLDFKNNVFKGFTATVIRWFAESSMTLKPPRSVPFERLRAIGCTEGCKDCLAIREFALDSRAMIQFSRPQVMRKHLEVQLKKHGFDAFGFTWQTIKDRTPCHVLQVRLFQHRCGRH